MKTKTQVSHMKKRAAIILVLSLFALSFTACSSQKTCSKKGKTKVHMGYM